MLVCKLGKYVSKNHVPISLPWRFVVTRSVVSGKGKETKDKSMDKEKMQDAEKTLTCEWSWDTCQNTVKLSNCQDDLCAIEKCVEQPCVVIIGGGIAGLSAAARLSQCGLTNFKLLEATDRPGGRLKSCWLGDSVVELGAQFILGACVANKVYTLAALEQLIKYPLDRMEHHCGSFLTSSGKCIPKDIVQKSIGIYQSIVSKAADLFMFSESTPHSTLDSYFNESICLKLKDVEDEIKNEVASVLYGLSNYLRNRLGADLKSIGSKSYGSYRQLPGGDIRVRNGLAGVLAPLLKPLPNCGITYCKPVTAIRWGTAESSLSPRAIVVTEDKEEFPCDYVIVTVSLGVLKCSSDCLFCPGLSANKMEAIKSLGYGHVNKIFLMYDKPFWSDNCGITLAWRKDELNDRCSWTKGISSFSPVFGSKNVLQTSVAGPEAKNFELLTDEEVAGTITELLRKFTGDPSIPDPIELVRSCWSTDPYYYGSYTYMGVNSEAHHIQSLADPLPDNCYSSDVPPIILFAGEHTSPRHFSTLHGARESGIREADRILMLTKKFCGPPTGAASCETCVKK